MSEPLLLVEQLGAQCLNTTKVHDGSARGLTMDVMPGKRLSVPRAHLNSIIISTASS